MISHLWVFFGCWRLFSGRQRETRGAQLLKFINTQHYSQRLNWPSCVRWEIFLCLFGCLHSTMVPNNEGLLQDGLLVQYVGSLLRQNRAPTLLPHCDVFYKNVALRVKLVWIFLSCFFGAPPPPERFRVHRNSICSTASLPTRHFMSVCEGRRVPAH